MLTLKNFKTKQKTQKMNIFYKKFSINTDKGFSKYSQGKRDTRPSNFIENMNRSKN